MKAVVFMITLASATALALAQQNPKTTSAAEPAPSSSTLAADATPALMADPLVWHVFTDLGQHLSHYGKTAALDEATRNLILYYEQLPAARRTRETQAAHALAIAGVGTISGWQLSEKLGGALLGEPAARAQLERAVRITEELTSGGDLTPFVRLSSAAVSYTMARQLFREHRYADTVAALERADKMLTPVAGDQAWGPWARQLLIKIVTFRASGFFRTGRPGAINALPLYERAVAYAEENERNASGAGPRGLRPLLAKADYAGGLFTAGEDEKARQLTMECRVRLREFVDRDPFLVTARHGVAWTAHQAAIQARATWDFAAWDSALREIDDQYTVLLKHDPTIWGYGTSLARSLTYGGESRCAFEMLQGNFAAAKAAVERATALWEVDWIPPGSHVMPRLGRTYLAWVCAAMGNDDEATINLQKAAARFERELAARVGLTDTERQSLWAAQQSGIRMVEIERLNWTAVRKSAEEVLARLPKNRPAHRDLMLAAFHTGDYALARRELDAAAPEVEPQTDPVRLQGRFTRVGNTLTRVLVLARAGEAGPAKTELAAAWSEVEAMLAAAPTFVANQVQTARALAIRAESESDAAAKREGFRRAAAYLRPAANSGRLTRFERDVLLTGIERQLAALGVADTQ